MIKKKGPQQQTLRFRLNEKHYKCGKKNHYIRDFLGHSNLKRKPKDEKIEQKVKYVRKKKNQTSTNRVATAKSNIPNKEFVNDFYPIRKALVIQEAIID